MKIVDSVIVSVSFDTKGNAEDAVLLVGRKKPNQAVDIIHAIQGEEAIELYKKIVNYYEE